jgi:magnesium transporter
MLKNQILSDKTTGSKIMPRLFERHTKKVGLPPGTFVHVGDQKMEEVLITLMDYNEKGYEFKEVDKVEDVFACRDNTNVSWINIYGLHEPEVLENIGTHFGIHQLILEDIANTTHRPKIELYDNFIFIVLKMIWFDGGELEVEQVSLIYGKNFVLCFQERKGDIFQSIRERIKTNQTRIRKSGADYLLYRIMDIVVDNYFLVLERMGDQIETLDEAVISDSDKDSIQEIYALKRQLIFLRKAIWPLREVVSNIAREENSLFKKSTLPFLRDLYDHTIQVIDTLETYRDLVSGLIDMYMTNVSNKMNEVMKVLTIIATIFIPLTFMAGIYGMNFEFMPELRWHYSYPILLLTMLLILIGMLLFFKRKKWL